MAQRLRVKRMVERWIYSVMSVSALGFIGYIVSLIFGYKENAKMVKFISIITLVVVTLQIISPLTQAIGGFFRKVDHALALWDKLAITNSGGWEQPVSGGKITQRFNGVDHHGLDIAVPEGTPVFASQDGIVSKVEWSDIYGQLVMVNYDNGLQILYGHNRDILVHRGSPVVKGTKIAYSGNTGNSTGPHLHLEVYENGNIVNPEKFFTN